MERPKARERRSRRAAWPWALGFGLLLLTTALPSAAIGASPVVNSVPNPTLTPGGLNLRVTQANLQQTICKFEYHATTKINAKTKRKVYAAYRIQSQRARSKYVLDHLVPFGLGGSNAAANLWPQTKSAARLK